MSAKTLADWITGIQAKYVYPFPENFDVEDNSTEAGYATGSVGRKVKASRPIWGEKYSIDVTAYEYVRMFSFDGAGGRLFLKDINGNFYGCSSDGTKVKGLKVNAINVTPYTVATGNGEIRKMKIDFEFSDFTEFSTGLVVFKPTFTDEIQGLSDCVLSSATWTTGGCVVTVKRACDDSGVVGLVAGDFVLVDDAGGSETISTLTAVTGSPGVYTLAATIAADGYVLNFKEPAAMTTKGYDSTAATTGTVS